MKFINTLSLLVLLFASLGVNAQADPDLPAFAPQTDKEAFFKQRDTYIAEKRGYKDLINLNFDARKLALDKKLAQETQMFQNRTSMIGVPNWTQLGPAPIPNGQTTLANVPVSGRVTSIAVHPTNSDIVYIGTANGGVYRSVNGGDSWTAIFDNAASLAIGAIVLSPLNPSILYVGTGEANFSADSYAGIGLYRIDNADASPILNGPINPGDQFRGRSISKILPHPTNADILYVSTTTGVSSNPGQGSANTPNLGVYRTLNATAAIASINFSQIGILASPNNNISVSDMVMDPSNPEVISAYLVATGGGIYKTTNASSATPTWTKKFNVPSNSNHGEFAIQVQAGVTTVYCVYPGNSNNGTILKSIDGGETYLTAPGTYNVCSGQCFYDIAVWIKQDDANSVLTGGSSGLNIVRKSTDGVATTPVSLSAGVHADVHSIVGSPSNPSTVYLGCDGGVYKSTDFGSTWISKNTTGLNATQFQSIALHPIDPKFTIGGTQDNGTVMQNPDGTFRRVDFGDGGYALIDQNATNNTNVTMYHTYFNNTGVSGWARVTNVANATDNGWDFLGCGGTPNGIGCPTVTQFYAPIAQGPGNPNTLYLGSDRLWRSTNTGTTATLASQGPIVSGVRVITVAIANTDDNVRAVGMANGTIWTTSTGSSTLVNNSPAGGPIRPVSRIVISPLNSDTAYASFGGYGLVAGQHIYKTTNLTSATPTWTPSGTGIPDIPVNVLAIDPTNSSILFAGTDIGVYVSDNSGATWESYSAGLPAVPVFDIAVHKVTHTVRIATHGRGLWESTNPVVLPVSLNLFTATAKKDGKVLLEWVTESESNNKGFFIERATVTNGAQSAWKDIGFVAGAGTTSSRSRYLYNDAPIGGKSFIYRLRQVDFDGRKNISENRVVNLQLLDPALNDAYPNPATSSTNIKYQIIEKQMVDIVLYDAVGKMIQSLVHQLQEPGTYVFELQTGSLPSGSYTYTMKAGTFTLSKKLIVRH